MGDDFNNGSYDASRMSSASSRYSRNEGVSAYRSRRRRSRVVRFVVAVVLVCIIGAAAFLFGRQYLDYSVLPFEVPGAEMYETSKPENRKEEMAAEPATTFEPVQVRVLGAGDVIMNGAVVESGQTEGGGYSFGHLFSPIASEIQSFDARLVDQETALAGSSYGFGNSTPLNAPQELGRAEADAGFNVILRATDHTLDTGWDGLHNELIWWHSEFPKMPIVGMTEADPEKNPGIDGYVNDVYMYEKEGFKIAILNHSCAIDEESWNVVSPLVEEKVNRDVAKAREQGADMIVACPHWGIEDDTELTDEQKTFSRIYANAGVDVIIGTNPRVLQRVEVLTNSEGHKTLCYYSLGCLVSSLYPDNLVGGLAEVTLVRDAEGKCSIESAVLKPVVTHRAAGDEYATYLVSDYTDELAQSSWDGSLTPEDIARRCREVLGDEYDSDAGELRIDLSRTVSV